MPAFVYMLPISAILLMTSMFCFPQNSKAVENTKNSGKTVIKSAQYFTEVTIGVSLPKGDFAGSDSMNNKAGYAITGGFIFANYGIIYNDVFGFEIAISININPVDTKADKMRKWSNPDEYDRGFAWGSGNIMAGPHLSLPYKKFALDVRILAGYLALRRPFYKSTWYSGDSISASISEEKTGHGGSFVYQVGMGLRYSVTKSISIKLSADYLSANPTIHYQRTNCTWYKGKVIYDAPQEINYKQQVKNINVGVGLVLNLHGNK
jgi:opacity protein-like surface antigen